MADRPFGFSLPDKPGDEGSGSGGEGGPQQFADALRQFADMLSWTGGPVNWDLAKNVARHAVSAAGDPSVLDAQRREVTEAIRLADLWLDQAVSYPSGVRKIEAWSRSEWVEATFPVWAKLCDPIAAKGVEAMSSMIPTDPAQLGDDVPEEMKTMLGALGGGGSGALGGMAGLSAMFRQIGGAMIGSQTGTAVGELAREVISSTDIGLPLGPEGTAALLPAGVTAFGQGLSVDASEVRLYVALREAAHQRLFAHVPWLRAHLLGAVEQYASGITMDMTRIQEAMPDVDLTNPEALQEALQGEGLFQPEDTPAQKAALSRLETALALVEGWVSTVVAAAANGRLSHADALAEAFRRRRATGGPAERTFATLVGLELRPRRLREAAAIWQGLTQARGIDGRDALWGHPDLLPVADDLENPEGFVHPQEPDIDISDLEDDELFTPQAEPNQDLTPRPRTPQASPSTQRRNPGGQDASEALPPASGAWRKEPCASHRSPGERQGSSELPSEAKALPQGSAATPGYAAKHLAQPPQSRGPGERQRAAERSEGLVCPWARGVWGDGFPPAGGSPGGWPPGENNENHCRYEKGPLCLLVLRRALRT